MNLPEIEPASWGLSNHESKETARSEIRSSRTWTRREATPCPGAEPDVRQLRDQELPAQPFPGGREQRFRICIDPAIHLRLWQHARESLEVEVCGVLVGAWGKDAGGPHVVVSEAIRGEAATSKFAEVTFTHETWAKINHEMDSKFAHLAIVGWYHTHPDFGIFLSDRDVFIQQHFFSGPGQVAYVLDPVRKMEGIFTWQEGKPMPASHYWIGDRLQTAAQAQRGEPGELDEPGRSGAAPVSSERSPPANEVAPGSFVNLLLQAMVYLAIFLVGYLLATRLTEAERNHIEQEAVARSALFLGVKPGLREALDRCLADLSSGVKEAQVLAADLPEEQRERWNTVREEFLQAQGRLRGMQALYCLSNGETERIVQLSAAVVALSSQGITSTERAQLARQLEKQFMQILKEGVGDPRGEKVPEIAPPKADAKSGEDSSKTAPAPPPGKGEAR
jgi:proteasome lid subunit RPN8/RPN11